MIRVDKNEYVWIIEIGRGIDREVWNVYTNEALAKESYTFCKTNWGDLVPVLTKHRVNRARFRGEQERIF